MMRIMAKTDGAISKPHVDARRQAERGGCTPVREERNVAMVYQQFINYPSLRVRDNIAS
jgi:glycerol transport system ATP-binding protein